jgi:hypothetical protein
MDGILADVEAWKELHGNQQYIRKVIGLKSTERVKNRA